MKVDRGSTLGLAFGSDSEVVACGVGFIKFFSLSDKSGELKSKKGLGLRNPKEALVSVIFLASDVVTGRAHRRVPCSLCSDTKRDCSSAGALEPEVDRDNGHITTIAEASTSIPLCVHT